MTPAILVAETRAGIAFRRFLFPRKRIENGIHLPQFAVPHGTVGFDALNANLSALFRIGISDPDHATESLVPSALDGNDFSRFHHCAQPADSRPSRRNIVGARHIQQRFILCVPKGNAKRHGNFHPRINPFRGLVSERLRHYTLGGQGDLFAIERNSRAKHGQFTWVIASGYPKGVFPSVTDGLIIEIKAL
jgi:hypothetical protein